MKLLVFAHKPPPHHGQSFMVQLLLDALGGDARKKPAGQTAPLECYHVNSRLSDGIADIGQVRLGKIFLLLKYCLQAIALRFRFGVENFYYVPANAARAPLYRDWIVLGLCRPFFKKIIYHWHAAGLGEWLASDARPWERWLSRRLLGRPDLSIVLRPFNRRDGLLMNSKRIVVVPNGIPDPCPRFDEEVRPRRLARAAARRKLLAGETLTGYERAQAGGDPQIFHVLFVSLCFRQKGLFDLVEAVALANQKLPRPEMRIELTVAGTFWLETERGEFEERIRQPDLQRGGPLVRFCGFVSGTEKHRLFVESDCLCFPTYYIAESFGLVLVEGMAFGLPLVTTNWREIPDLLPAKYPGVVDPRSPEQIATVWLRHLGADHDESLRPYFLNHYTVEKFAQNIRAALAGV